MKVSDLTVEQLKFIIEEIIDRKLVEYFGARAESPEIPPDMSEEMRAQMMARAAGIADEQLLKELGLNTEEQNNAH
jgi:hypothetical protein